MARNILVVEDDNNISNLIKMYLDKEGFDVRIAADGGKAVEEFKEKEPDLVLLDVMLPVLDGWGVCAKIRETSKCPIIMLTAKGEVNDRIHGLEMGADDYVVKPFEMKELLARINAVLRRSEIPEDTHKRLTFDKLIIDLDSYELIVDGKKIDTPPKELELLYRTASTRATSCLTRCGASTTSAIRARWTYTSRGSAKRSKTSATSGRSRPSGASGINSK
jgi:two-component system response regulator ResD